MIVARGGTNSLIIIKFNKGTSILIIIKFNKDHDYNLSRIKNTIVLSSLIKANIIYYKC